MCEFGFSGEYVGMCDLVSGKGVLQILAHHLFEGTLRDIVRARVSIIECDVVGFRESRSLRGQLRREIEGRAVDVLQ